MCFGGGGGSSPPPVVNVQQPQAPIVKQPEPPKELTAAEYKPVAPLQYQPGVQQAGSSTRRRDPLGTRQTMARRRGLSIGISGSQAAPPSGGINL